MIFISGAMFGTQGIFVKILESYGSTPSYTVTLRMTSAFIIMLCIVLAMEGPKALKVSRHTLLSCAVLGIVCHAMNNACYAAAIVYGGMSIAASLLYFGPVVTFVCARILFGEKFNSNKTIALIMNVTGCILAITGGDFTSLKFDIRGILFGFGAGICFGLLPIVSRFATSSDDDSPLAVTMYCFMFSSLFLCCTLRGWTTVAHPLDSHLIIYGSLLGLVCTVITYIMYFTAIKGITEASKVPIVQSDEVIATVLIGIFMYREPMNVISMIGVLLVFTSIILINRKSNAQ